VCIHAYFVKKRFVYCKLGRLQLAWVLIMAACAQQVVILGHSFIRRLRDFVHSSEDNYNLRLREGDIFVSFHARGGLTIYRLANTPAMYNFSNQDVCFIQIGSNDLSDPTKAVSEIGSAILSCGFG
jgi:hypothetical protein